MQARMMPVTTTGNSRAFSGTAVPYNTMSSMLYDKPRPYRERIEPGSVRWNDSTVLMSQHDQRGIPLARVSSGTLKFWEEQDGLKFSALLPESRSDIQEALERGDLDGSVSIGFICHKDKWQHTRSASVRTVHDAEMVELSLVVSGAYGSASGSMES